MYSKVPVVLFLCTVVLSVSEVGSYKILGVFPFFSPSHYFLGNELMKGLAEAGHDVTILTIFEEQNPPKNAKYRQIIMEGLAETQKAMFAPMLTNFSAPTSQNVFTNPFKMILKISSSLKIIVEETLKNTKMQDLIKSKERFDVVIIPQFMLEAVKALAPHLNAHLVLLANNAMNSWVGHFVGNSLLPSIDPEGILAYTGQMNFKERFVNTLMRIGSYSVNTLINYPAQRDLVHKYISKDINLVDVQYNTTLILSNTHASLNTAQGSVPVIKEIGGFHVKPPIKLPEDLKKYMDNAKEGVILFSMGSNLKGADLPLQMRKDLLSAFSKRKEKILWKFETDLPDKPSNVRIEKWLPQSDILAHPNTKLFITHGGFLSTIETVYHGVPTVAIPIFADQLKNAKLAVFDGYAFLLEFKNLNEEIISNAIEEVLSNKKYFINVKKRSKIFHDRPMKPLDEAIYWIEYIIRHKGANHLKVNYLNLSWYEYYLVDVFIVYLAVIFLVLFITKKVLCGILGLCINKNQKKSEKLKKS